jgi:hypothetical protein
MEFRDRSVGCSFPRSGFAFRPVEINATNPFPGFHPALSDPLRFPLLRLVFQPCGIIAIRRFGSEKLAFRIRPIAFHSP